MVEYGTESTHTPPPRKLHCVGCCWSVFCVCCIQHCTDGMGCSFASQFKKEGYRVVFDFVVLFVVFVDYLFHILFISFFTLLATGSLYLISPFLASSSFLIPCLCVGVLQAAIASLCPSLPSVQYPVVSLFRFSFLAPRSSLLVPQSSSPSAFRVKYLFLCHDIT